MRNSTPIIALILSAISIGAASCNQPITYPEGGYDYPEHFTARDTAFYYCPLKKFFSRKDSFGRATDFFALSFFKEPNLSIKPYGQDIFRLVYTEALGYSTFITLTNNEIIIKKPYFTSTNYPHDNKLLTKMEQYLLHVLQRRFPLDSGKYESRPFIRKQLDSLLRIYPQLRDVNYYWSLENKRLVPDTNMKVEVIKIPIARRDFNHIVSVINASGYWKMPYKLSCDSPPTDADGFALEANTTKKYNYVEFYSCTDNTPVQVAFEKACMEIVKYGKLDKEISLVSDWRIEPAVPDSGRIDSVK